MTNNLYQLEIKWTDHRRTTYPDWIRWDVGAPMTRVMAEHQADIRRISGRCKVRVVEYVPPVPEIVEEVVAVPVGQLSLFGVAA